MNWNYKRTIAIGLSLALFSLCALPARTAAQGSDPCAESRGKRMAKTSTAGVVLGGLIGAIVSKNNAGKSAAIGMLIGGGVGAAASAKKPAACSNPPEAMKGPYNATIADASEPAMVESDTPGVLLRDVTGANRTALGPTLIQDLPKRGFGLVDERSYGRDGSVPVRYYLDVLVVRQSSSQGYNGGGFSRASWSQYGNRSTGGDLYQVSVTMIDAKIGRPDPSRTRTMLIDAINYTSQNGNYTVANISGYDFQSVWANDTATGAAIAAINVFFGAVPPKR